MNTIDPEASRFPALPGNYSLPNFSFNNLLCTWSILCVPLKRWTKLSAMPSSLISLAGWTFLPNVSIILPPENAAIRLD